MKNLKDEVVSALAEALKGKASANEIEALLEVPPNPEMGDLAFPCFKVCRAMKCRPEEAAATLCVEVKSPKSIERIEHVGPYLNFYFRKTKFAEQALGAVLGSGAKYGSNKEGAGKKVMVEYSQPNTNKPLHIGHLRNDSLGMCISNVLENSGCKVVKANLINDRGIHISKSMLAYMKWGRGKTPKDAGVKGDKFVGDFYVRFSKEAEKNPKLEDEARTLLKQWEKGDKKVMALWKKMNGWVIDGFKQTYREFGSVFDTWLIESDFYGKAEPVIKEGLKKGVFVREPDNAIMAKLEKHGLSDKTILRSDGTSLYITNDLSATKHKFEHFKLNNAYWVVGNEQNHYFRQLFLIFKLLGYPWAEKCRHVAYGMVNLPEGKLKSREGKVVDADLLIEDMRKLAEKEVRSRHEGLNEREIAERSRKIALGAIKFFMLRTDAAKDLLFEPEKAISFEGESGPYVQYSYARARSILRKAGKAAKSPAKADFSQLQEPTEKELITILGNFPQAVGHVQRGLSPHTLCQHLLELSAKFNSFYHELPVLQAEPVVRDARLALVEAVCIVLKRGLELLGIEELEEM